MRCQHNNRILHRICRRLHVVTRILSNGTCNFLGYGYSNTFLVIKHNGVTVLELERCHISTAHSAAYGIWACTFYSGLRSYRATAGASFSHKRIPFISALNDHILA